MSLLSAEDQNHVRHFLEPMTSRVRLVVFTDDEDCRYCRETLGIAEEVAGLSEKIEVEHHDLAAEPELARLYRIDKAPAIAIVQVGEVEGSSRDFGLRFYGIPSGYEFMTLLEDTVMVSSGDPKLSPPTLAWLATLQKPVHLQVFVTPTCPYCPQMVGLAHRLAVASPLVTADGVEATEFPELSEQYGVYGVPRTVISAEGGEEHVEGAVPEARLLDALRKVVGRRLEVARR